MISSILATAAPRATSDSQSNSASNATPLDPLANEQAFLQLLVAQLKNQDPTQPQDGTQFVAQIGPICVARAGNTVTNGSGFD